MINKLTGEEVSTEMLNILEQLKLGKSVEKEIIDNTKEMKEAYSCVSQSVSTHMLKNRDGIQTGVLNQLQNLGSAVTKSDGTVAFTGKIRCAKRIDIIIGLPAAGKSSALAEPISELLQSRIVDSDEAKKRLPEYNNGWGAQIVHKESQQISDTQWKKAVSIGENIVYPRVGGDCVELEKYISQAKEQGYKVYLHFNDLDKNKALGRMINRFLETGRFIQPELITKYGNSIENTYQTLKNSPLIDGYSKWNNDVPLGCRPKLVEYSQSCEELCAALICNTTMVEKLNKLKTINEKLTDKIKEVNDILKENPELCAKFVAARDKFRKKHSVEKVNEKPKTINNKHKNKKKL